jgi:hypothetical protein
MKLNELKWVHLGAARPLPVIRCEPGWRGAMATLKTRLVRAWVGLYAPPPRQLPPLL